jgi:hypothetical protein
MRIFKLIPFWLWPGSWGLRGRTRKMAEIEYYHEGEDRDRRLAMLDHEGNPEALAVKLIDLDLKYGKLTPYEHDRKLAELRNVNEHDRKLALLTVDLQYGRIDLYEYERQAAMLRGTEVEIAKALLEVEVKHRKISEYEHAIRLADLDHGEGDERTLARLKIDLQHGKITQVQHDKGVATVADQPYVGIVDSSYDTRQGVNGLYFEFDWNEAFIALLKDKGYVGMTDEQIVNSWFDHLCQSMAQESILSEETDEPLQVRTRSQRRDTGRTEHS